MYYRNGKRYDNYGNPILSQQMKYTKLVVGHEFNIVDAGTTPDGTFCKCDFCGMLMKHWVAVKREDGIKVKVGRTCLEKVGLELPKEFKEKMSLPKSKHKKSKNTKKTEKKETLDLEDDLLKILDNI